VDVRCPLRWIDRPNGRRQIRVAGQAQDAIDVRARLGKGRDSPVACYGFCARVVRGEGDRQVSGIAIDERSEMSCPAIDVLCDIEDIVYPKQQCSPRHQLHEALRPLR